MSAAAALLLFAVTAVLPAQDREPPAPKPPGAPGYRDTPLLPGSRWRVHDADRPRPPVVRPAPAPEPPVPPPSDAIVLFDGRDLSAWTGKDGGAARWQVEDGAFVANRTGDVRSKESFADCQLHVEWMAPVPARGENQSRGNSGVFLMDRYEVQILDSFENVTYADGQAAALYGQAPPLVNASRPPGEWQTFDIVFRAPRFEGERLVAPARVTVLHNGVLVHDAQPVFGATRHREVATYSPHGPAPIRLQDHGDPVRFRNVWVRRLPQER